MPECLLTRVEHFSAAHRLHNSAFTTEKNEEIFGKCNRSHGHNYLLETTLKGKIDPQTGMVINLSQLKSILRQVLDTLDHCHLDLDIPYFRDNNIVSTTENLAVFIWKSLREILPNPTLLYEVKLYETSSNWVVYRGEE